MLKIKSEDLVMTWWGKLNMWNQGWWCDGINVVGSSKNVSDGIAYDNIWSVTVLKSKWHVEQHED